MVKTGLDIISAKWPAALKGKRIGVLCHAASIRYDLRHIIDLVKEHKDSKLAAVFGPQHGLFGQTQDNMIEWEGERHTELEIPVFSLYGKARKPSPEMLKEIDVLIIDLQDAGARLYTYNWTMKLCMEACTEAGIPVWILDRPNPIGILPPDGPVLKENYFTFVGGAAIPMCHRMTTGELSLWLKENYYPQCDLNIARMEGWKRNSLFSATGLPWVLPSPNMPTLQTAIVYPGTVLFEAMNISEGRGTTIPFELAGAPFINTRKLLRSLAGRNLKGCLFREHDFIPTFNKFTGEICHGIQIHVTDPADYHPVEVALELIDAMIETSPEGSVRFNDPPYEYEYDLMPFDILSGDPGMRDALESRSGLTAEKERWRADIERFLERFRTFKIYPEN